jgi:hypothetical protein
MLLFSDSEGYVVFLWHTWCLELAYMPPYSERSNIGIYVYLRLADMASLFGKYVA